MNFKIFYDRIVTSEKTLREMRNYVSNLIDYLQSLFQKLFDYTCTMMASSDNVVECCVHQQGHTMYMVTGY